LRTRQSQVSELSVEGLKSAVNILARLRRVFLKLRQSARIRRTERMTILLLNKVITGGLRDSGPILKMLLYVGDRFTDPRGFRHRLTFKNFFGNETLPGEICRPQTNLVPRLFRQKISSFGDRQIVLLSVRLRNQLAHGLVEQLPFNPPHIRHVLAEGVTVFRRFPKPSFGKLP